MYIIADVDIAKLTRQNEPQLTIIDFFVQSHCFNHGLCIEPMTT